VAVASIHDLGIGCYDADLLIDGSVIRSLAQVSPGSRINGISRPGRSALPGLPATRRALTGPSFAIVDPRLTQLRHSARSRHGVVVSLGGGPRAEVACAIAEEIARRAPDVQVRVVGGFVSSGPPKRRNQWLPNVAWVGASTNLAKELGNASVAVVGGGVSLYEACALGTAAVGVPVVNGQRPTVAGFVARGAALGRPRAALVPRRVAADALKLLREERLRKFVARSARRLIDGRGAIRVARAIARLTEASLT
jgi:spore coat polysaccharide biosynthesis predicted glycosyltransferase SpsG